MNILLFFAFPVATIILAIVLQKILRCAYLTAATFFAIYLIVAFTAFDESFLIYAIIYTILAYIAAVIAEMLFQRCNCQTNNNSQCNCCRSRQNNVANLSDEDINRIAIQLNNIQNRNNSCNCNSSNDIVTANIINNTTGGRTSWCCYRR